MQTRRFESLKSGKVQEERPNFDVAKTGVCKTSLDMISNDVLRHAIAKPFQKIMQYVGQHGIVRPRDIEAIGLPREYLVRLHRQGKLSRSGRGIYTLPDANVTERHSYAEVAKRVPEAVICLLSALTFHEITTQSPASVWIALGKGARTPALRHDHGRCTGKGRHSVSFYTTDAPRRRS